MKTELHRLDESGRGMNSGGGKLRVDQRNAVGNSLKRVGIMGILGNLNPRMQG